MTTLKKTGRALSRFAIRELLCVLAIAGTAGCSVNSLLEPGRVDYKSASTKKGPSLEIPPDLTQLEKDNRYAIPDNANRGTATASGFSQQQTNRPAAAETAVVAQPQTDMRIERAGSQRWLVVKQSPEVLWPQIKEFWQDSGFLINSESAQTGIMETDWAENRAKIPQDFIRNTLGKIIDSAYSTGERDKFRTRLERGPDGSTEIYISHRGAQEVVTGAGQERGTVWTPRPPNPELEAEFLSRLMARLGKTEVKAAQAMVANAPLQQPRAKLVKDGGTSVVQVDEAFDRAWRRVGLALDRVGFTVEDRDRAQGTYFVRYVDQASDAQTKSEKGFLGRLFTFGDKDKAKSAQRYRILVKSAGTGSQVTVLNSEGNPENSTTGDRILTLLNEQLK